jgi:uncharacterized protein (UPF0303 family)
MKVEELINSLRHMRSDANISVSIDISTGEEDADNRVFSEDIIGVQQDNDQWATILCEEGYTNLKED